MPSYTDNSTLFGSIIISFTSSGRALYSKLVMMLLRHTLLPEPVAPAMSKCNIFVKSATSGLPPISRPSAMANGDFICRNSLRLDNFAQKHRARLFVRHFDADDGFAGHRRLHPHARRGQIECNVVGQARRCGSL